MLTHLTKMQIMMHVDFCKKNEAMSWELPLVGSVCILLLSIDCFNKNDMTILSLYFLLLFC